MKLALIDPGIVPYREAWDMQMHLREKRIAGEIPDTLVLLEHPPVITLGRRAGREDILISEETARREGVDIVPIDRGGEVTYHGPGQLVGYLIFDIALTGGSIRDFVYLLEEGLIRVLDKGWGVKAGRSAEHRGVWVGDEKIAALGLSVSRHVTMHGFALNVNTDLRHFRWIVPCGIRDKGVTSLEKITGSAVPMEKVKTRAAAELAEVFGFEGVETADFPERKKHEG